MSDLTDVYAEHQAIERMLKGGGTKMRWIADDAPSQVPYADLKTRVIYLPKLKYDYSEHDRRMHRAMCWHENGHLDPSQDGVLEAMREEDVNFSSYLGKAINGINDVWQEMVASQRYIGAGQDLDYVQGYFCRKGVEMKREGGTTDEFIYKVLALCYLARAEWQETVALYAEEFSKYTDLNTIMHLIPRINGLIDHPDAAREQIKIAREIFDECDDAPDPEESPDDGDSSGNGEGGDGDAESEGQTSDTAEGSGGDDEEGESGPAVVSYKDLMAHDHGDSEVSGDKPAPLTIKYDHDPADDYSPALPSDFTFEVPEGLKLRFLPREIADIRNDTAHVSGAIKRLFQSESQTKRIALQKRGRLTTKHLARLPAGETRVFNRTVNRVNGDADVYLLIDCSGSMASGYKYASAVNACGALAEALMCADVPCKVAGFTDDMGKPVHYTFKDWHEPATWEKLEPRFQSVSLMDNADGDSIMQAYREMKVRQAKRKVLIVLSDGQPATIRDGDCWTYTKKVVAHIEKTMEVYGVGINTNAVNEIYSQACVLHNPSDIEETLTNIVKNCILESK